MTIRNSLRSILFLLLLLFFPAAPAAEDCCDHQGTLIAWENGATMTVDTTGDGAADMTVRIDGLGAPRASGRADRHATSRDAALAMFPAGSEVVFSTHNDRQTRSGVYRGHRVIVQVDGDPVALLRPACVLPGLGAAYVVSRRSFADARCGDGETAELEARLVECRRAQAAVVQACPP